MRIVRCCGRLALAVACLTTIVVAARCGLGVAQEQLPVEAPPLKVPPAVAHRPSPLPDRIILTWAGDPARSQAVTWRTDTSVTEAVAEIARSEDGPGFAPLRKAKKATAEAPPKVRTVPATTTPLRTDLGMAHYHAVQFTGLDPSTLYVYRVGDGVNWSEWFQFRTASAKPEPFTFIYVGDAQNNIKEHWSRVIRQAVLDAPKARFLLHAGDLINSANSDAEWGEWFQAGGWINGTIPSIVTPGNHEYFDANAYQRRLALQETLTRQKDKGVAAEATETDEDKAKAIEKDLLRTIPRQATLSRHWRKLFTLPENGPEGLEETVYYLDYQGVRIISLNSNETEKDDGSKKRQAAWLEKVLADNPNRWTIVTFHHPVLSTAKNRDNPALRKLWQPLFDKYRVDLVLTGHDHSYGRSGLLTANELSGTQVHDRAGGTVYCVSVSGPKMYELNPQAWMVRSAEGIQLYQIISLDGNTLRYEARTATGSLFDLFELRKRPDGTNELVERDRLGSAAGKGVVLALLACLAALLALGMRYLGRSWQEVSRPLV